jgi:hypothetical protein
VPGCAVRDDDDRDTTHAVADPSKTTAQKRLGLLRPAGQAHPEAAGRSTNQMPVRSKSLLAGVASSITWGQRTRTSSNLNGLDACMVGWLVPTSLQRVHVTMVKRPQSRGRGRGRACIFGIPSLPATACNMFVWLVADDWC